MDQRIHQEEGHESRPNFSCDDGIVFIYNPNSGIYEPYERSKEDRNAEQKGIGQHRGSVFGKFMRKRWKFLITTFISLATLAVVSFYTWYAKQSNEINGKSLTAVQRAFVNSTSAVDSIPLNPIDKVSKEATSVKFAVPFFNSGNTPTIGMAFYCRAQVRNSEPTNADFGDFDSTHQYKIDLAPKGRMNCYIDNSISRDDIGKTRLRKGSEDLYIWGWSTYSDVFNHPHKIKFLYVVSEITGDPLIPGKGGYFTWFVKDTHNCVDEECDAQK